MSDLGEQFTDSSSEKKFFVGCSTVMAFCIVCSALMTAVSVFVLKLMGVV